MALLNFPPNPVIGQKYTIGSNTWEWNGVAWIKVVPPKNIADVFTVTDVLYITSTTNAFSTNSGALQVVGGVGIGKNLWVGEELYVLSTSTFGGNLLPNQTDVFDLGSPSARWGTLYISSATIDIGGAIISSQDGIVQTEKLSVTGTDTSTSSVSGALQISGGLGVAKDVWIDGSARAAEISIPDVTFYSTSTSVNTTATVNVDSFSLSTYRSAEYLAQITSGVGTSATFQISKIMLIVDNTSTVYATEYAIIHTEGPGATFGIWSTDVSGGSTVNLYFTPDQSSDKVIKIARTSITV